MAITATTLAADLGASDVTMRVTSGTGFPTVGAIPTAPYLVRIDSEYMLAVGQPISGTVTIAQRGYNGTAAVAHDILANVLVSASPSDFSQPSAGNVVDLTPSTPLQGTIGEDVTFTSAQIAGYGSRPRVFAITKATAAAITLVAPSKAQDGLTLTFTSNTAAAHVITATSLLADAVSGSPHTTATFAAYKGATLTLQAQNGLYNVVGSVGVTIT